MFEPFCATQDLKALELYHERFFKDLKNQIYFLLHSTFAKTSITPNSPKIIIFDKIGDRAALDPGVKVVDGEDEGLGGEPATTGDVPVVEFNGGRFPTGPDGPIG